MERLGFAFAFLSVGFALGWMLKPASIPSEVKTRGGQPGQEVPANTHHPAVTSTERAPFQIQEATDDEPGVDHAGNPQRDNHNSALDTFKWLLTNKRYREAVDFFQDVHRTETELAFELKRELLTTLQQQLDSAEFNHFSLLAELWLAAYYSDIDVLLLLANYNSMQNYFGEAINLYQIIYSYAQREGELAKIDSEYSQFVRARDERLLEKQAWYELQNFYELLEQAGIAKSIQRFRLAEIYVHNGYPDHAWYILQQLVGGLHGDKAEELLANLDSNENVELPISKAERYTLPLERMGHHFIANLQLANEIKLKLLVDTGASITSVSQSAFVDKLANVGYQTRPSRLFHTANGIVRGEVLQISSAYLGGFELHGTDIAVVPMPESQDVDGLLGMNILSQFQFHIDQEASELVLSRK